MNASTSTIRKVRTLQVNMALDHLVRNATDLHIDPEAIVLAGDSAGAQIAAQLAIITTDVAYARRIGIVPSLPPEHLRAMLLLYVWRSA